MHLTVDEALDLIEGRARESQITFWNAHSEICDDCRKRLETWREMHTRMGSLHLQDAPETLIRNAEAIFAAPSRLRVPTLRQVLASIVFDSFAQPAVAGARGAATTRQIVMQAETFDIHLKISGDPNQRRVTGQVLARGESTFVGGAMLHLVRNGERFESTSVDKLGEFEFRGIPDGALSLQMDMPHLTIVGALNA